MDNRPIVAVVGRPNVGKSTLFNKLAGKRISIVEDTPGVTRDRIFTEVEWLNKYFTLIDTGGIEPENDDIILFGDSMYTCYSSDGNRIMDYQYPGVLTDASYCDSGAAMIFENKERKSATLSVIDDPSSGNVTEVKIQNSFRCVESYESGIFLLAEDAIEAYDYEGRVIKTAELSEPFRAFYKSGKYIFLEGHNKIERIEF